MPRLRKHASRLASEASGNNTRRTTASFRQLPARDSISRTSLSNGRQSSELGCSQSASLSSQVPYASSYSSARSTTLSDDRRKAARVQSFDSIDENGTNDELDSGDLPMEVILALDVRSGNDLGCASFLTANGSLEISEDLHMFDSSVVEHVINVIQPTTILASAKAPESFWDLLELLSGSKTDEDHPQRFILRALASGDFIPASAQEKLLNLRILDPSRTTTVFVGNDDDLAYDNTANFVNTAAHRETRKFRTMRLGSLINLDSLASVGIPPFVVSTLSKIFKLGCAGAVLAELHRRRSFACLSKADDNESEFCVDSLQMFSFDKYLFLNADTLQSLQILHSEAHPNSQTWGSDLVGGGMKESLSVFGLLYHLASTPQGRIQLRQFLLRPTLDIEVIEERQIMIGLFLRPENAELIKQAAAIMRKIRNVRRSFMQLRKGVDFPPTSRSFNKGVWATLKQFAAQGLKLREVMNSISGSDSQGKIPELARKISQSALLSVGEMISKTIDFAESEARRRTSVNAGIDTHLDGLKRRYDGMGSFLTEVVSRINQRLPEWACQYIRSCIFLPQLGFLTVVDLDPQSGSGRYEGEAAGNEQWEKVFTTDDIVCYKNHYMRELDEQFGDMYCEIGGKHQCSLLSAMDLDLTREDREVEIIHRLATEILKFEDELIAASDAAAYFDAVLALAFAAEKYQWRAPQMTRRSVLAIEDGRHPLQELVVPAFVPNSCHLVGGAATSSAESECQANILALSGPNQSGKSIFMKQVAIIVYMAHIGSFVPASRAIIGLTDRILTRITTRESVCQTNSAFATDLKQIAQAMRLATGRSLVIVDEFGKGTNPDDGVGLMAAVFNHFGSLGQAAPRLLVATHFHELIEGGYLKHLENVIQFAHMDVKMEWEADSVEDQITYLFKLTPGYSTSSFGCRVAALNGIPKAIVDRAEAISELVRRNEDLSALCDTLSPDEERQLELAEEVARRFIQIDFESIAKDCQSDVERNTSVHNVLRSILGIDA